MSHDDAYEFFEIPYESKLVDAAVVGMTKMHDYPVLAKDELIVADEDDVQEIDPRFVNPLTPTGIMWDDKRQRYVSRIDYDAGPAPSDDELMQRLQRIYGGDQKVYDRLPLVPDILNPSKWLETSTSGRAMFAERPKYVRTADFPRWPKLPVCFPVYVGYPHFGAGLALRHIAFSINNQPSEQYFAVMKFTPLGMVQGAPFNGGIWSVPARWCLRMPLAVMNLVPAEDYVELVDDRGERWGESYVSFAKEKRWEYKVARDALVRDYPTLLAAVMCTRLRVRKPRRLERKEPYNFPSERSTNLRDANEF